MPAAVDSSRAQFYRQHFPDFWSDVGGEPYAMFEVHALDRRCIDEIRRAAADAWHIFARVAPVLRALPDDELLAIGIPATALRACRLRDRADGEGCLARFDLALTADGPKVLELNAETPMFLWESYEIAGAAAQALGFADANDGSLATLRAALRRRIGTDAGKRVAVTAYNTWREDWFSATFAARVASEALGRPVDVIPLHELRVADNALRDPNGAPIDVLWRFYPLEQMATDRDGPKLFELLERGALTLINPASSLLLQNKATQAIIWGLAQSAVWFDPAERTTISRLFLPTFLDQPTDDGVYVRKPVFGREGSSIAIVRGSETIAQSPGRKYLAQPAVYQQFVELPRLAGGTAIVTCFVLDGVPGPIALRVGDLITDGHSRFVPIGIAR
jgi:glutathionylspermidine synthase